MPGPPRTGSTVASSTVAGWRLGRALGRGASSAVYLAERGDGSTPVALKLVALTQGDAEAAAAFLRQAQAARRLVHPDIVQLLDCGVEGATGWLAMEPVPGTDLTRYARPSRLLPEAVVLRLCERMARALAHAHGAGFVHRDLKPANVLVHLPGDVVKLADLGLVRPVTAESTRTGVMAGTPAYMAPEQLAGLAADARSDLYAFGVTLFELLTGRLPHDAPTLGELLRRVTNETAPDLRALRPELPAELAALLSGLLERRPERRPPDALGVAEALHQVRAAQSERPGAKSRR